MFFEWLINKNKEKFYPITHSDGVLVGDDKLTNVLNKKQEKLVSSENIKTINGESILGSGDIEIQGGEGGTQLIKGDYYSEEETCIGRYINGKPIYRKMLNGTNDRNVDVRDLNIDNLIFADIICSNSSDNVKILLSSTTTSSHFRELWFEDGYIKYFMDNSVIVRKIILEYTKTTDTAETPIPESVLPTSLIKGENYSTEEQVVGRWVDGRPVYQKTFVGNLAVNNILIPNFNESGITIISTDGYAENENTSGTSLGGIAGHGMWTFSVHCSTSDYNLVAYVGDALRAADYVITLRYVKEGDTPTTSIQTSILNSDEIQAMIDASIGSVLGGEF